MKSKIPFFNWSLDNILKDETDTFLKAKYKIMFAIFVLFFIKALIAIYTAIYFEQNFQLIRAIVFMLFSLLLLKVMLSQALPFKITTHIVIIGCLILIYTNLLITAKDINIITLQFVFTLILSSFYVLGLRCGITYSILSIIPVIISLLIGYTFNTSSGLGSLASPGYEIIVVLNFATIIFIPYLFYQAFVKTIEEKEALNNQLMLAVSNANEAVKVKSNFLSTMSHELRTPLNTVIGTTDLLIADEHQAHQTDNLANLKFSANSLLYIINDILDYNKLDSYKVELEAIPVEINKLVNSVCASLASQATEKNIELKLQLDADLDKYCLITDPNRISQIIYNLLGNAIKFTAVGQVLIKLNILKLTENTITVQFSIKDTGIGIGQEQQKSVFEPFSQASTSITRDFGGTGLGLSIVKKLLLLFKSTIKLESTTDKGSEFYFDIDFEYHVRPNEKHLQQTEKSIEVQDLSDLNILVAEDNLMNRVLIKKVLSKWNNVPTFAEDGQEAVEKAAVEKFDVILMDLHMPIVDGYEASKKIKADNCSLSNHAFIIAFTASISSEILAEVNACGMVDFLYKPFDANEMYSKLRNLYPVSKK